MNRKVRSVALATADLERLMKHGKALMITKRAVAAVGAVLSMLLGLILPV